METTKVLVELEGLQDRIDLIDSNLKFNITIFLGLLTLFFALSGWALYLFAKSIVKQGIDRHVKLLRKEFNDEYDNKVNKLKEGVITVSGSNSDGHYYIWGNNRLEITSKVRIRMESNKLTGQVFYPAIFSKVFHINLQLVGIKESTIGNYSILTSNESVSGFKLEVKSDCNFRFVEQEELYVTVHVIGESKD